MKRIDWRQHLSDIANWLKSEATTPRERLLLDYLLALMGYSGLSWRVEVTFMRDRLYASIEDRTPAEDWVMEKLWLLCQAGAKNSGVTEEDIWK